MLKPTLKWAGGKRWLVSYLQTLEVLYHDRRLVEPFCGGLSVSLGLCPQQALLNDINPYVINFYQCLQKGFRIDHPMMNESAFYYSKRREFNWLTSVNPTTEDGKQSKADRVSELFYYLNHTGYNGLCRFNKKGGYNVPFGKYKAINYMTDFTDYKETLSRWTFMCRDFEVVPVSPGDFIYSDPPYDVPFRQYSKDGFTWDDQVRLANWLKNHDGPVVASNQATDRIIDLYSSLGFKVEKLKAPRMISCTGDRTKAEEILATRNF